MALGRKRLAAGIGLLALGATIAAGMLVSRWYALTFDLRSGAFLNVREGYVGWVGGGGSSLAGFFTTSNPSTSPAISRMTFEPVNQPMIVWWWDFPAGNSIIDIGIFRHVGDLSKSSLANWPRGYSGRFCLWPLALAHILLGSAFIASRRWWRLKPSLCPACGYDMKGLAARAGCPECGKVDFAFKTPQGSTKVAGGNAPGHRPQ